MRAKVDHRPVLVKQRDEPVDVSRRIATPELGEEAQRREFAALSDRLAQARRKRSILRLLIPSLGTVPDDGNSPDGVRPPLRE
jgi:hypothetical protein